MIIKSDTKCYNSYNNNNNRPQYELSKDVRKEHKFAKNVVLPFFTGVVGASLVMGICFGVPSIKNSIIGTQSTPIYTQSQGKNSTPISISNFSNTSTSVAEKVLPSIVGIKITYNVSSIFGVSPNGAEASGSGIIISNDGYILTNNHVVSSSSDSSSYYVLGEATSLKVYLYNDENGYDAKIVGTDETSDLALLKIEKNDLTAATLGNSDSLKVGEFVMAVGNPLDMQSSVTTGVISATNRKVTTDGKTFTLLQTDAAINQGNSGGALVNSNGEVIGINTLKLAGTGIEGLGFAIPINSSLSIIQELKDNGKVARPYIGITGMDLDAETAKQHNLVEGIYVKSIANFSPAEKGGLQIADIIVKVDGKEVKTMDQLNEIKNQKKVGDSITLTINRDGAVKDLKITLQEKVEENTNTTTSSQSNSNNNRNGSSSIFGGDSSSRGYNSWFDMFGF